jgi:hypothetical protein
MYANKTRYSCTGTASFVIVEHKHTADLTRHAEGQGFAFDDNPFQFLLPTRIFWFGPSSWPIMSIFNTPF